LPRENFEGSGLYTDRIACGYRHHRYSRELVTAALNMARDSAKEISCVNNEKQIGMGIILQQEAKMKKVFVIGDSISCYYGKFLEKFLEGIMEYDRKGRTHVLKDLDATNGINGGSSAKVLTYINEVINENWFKPDILLFNCGLHDIKIDQKTNVRQVSPESYEKNLEAILSILKEHNISPTWVRSTPLNKKAIIPPPEVKMWRTEEDMDRYNTIADGIMAKNLIPVIDLFNFTKKFEGEEIYINDGKDLCHFTDEMAAKQATFIAGYLSCLIS